MTMFCKRNSNAIDFISQRNAGLFSHGPKNQVCSQFNLDPWVQRFTCIKNDSFVVPGNYFVDCPPFSCKFAKDSAVLAVASEEGDILMLNGSSIARKNMLLKRWNAHGNAIFDICWVPNKPQLLSASGDHTVALHDVKTSEKISTFLKHAGSVKSVDACLTQPAVFASGSRDGSVIVWDMRVGGLHCPHYNDKPEIIINDAHSQNIMPKKNRSSIFNQLRSVTAISFQDEFSIASAGVSDSTVKIWDLRKTYLVHNKSLPVPKQLFHFGEKNSKQGCTSLRFDSTRNYLFACCTDNTVLKFDCWSDSTNAESCYSGLKTASYFIKLSISPDDQYIVCGSSNQSAHIWKVSQPGLPLVKLSGHSDEVTAVEWHPTDMSKLATCGDDNLVFIWNIVGSDRDLSGEEILGTCDLSVEECIAKKPIYLEFSEDYSQISSPREVKLKERSLREFFSSTSPGNASEKMKEGSLKNQTMGVTARKNSISSPKSGILQPLSAASLSNNRKRKIVDNETNNSHSEETSSQLQKNTNLASENIDLYKGESSDDKENCRTPVKSSSSFHDLYHERTETSHSSKKLCKTPSGKSPGAKKRSPKSLRQKTKLITSYFHAENTPPN